MKQILNNTKVRKYTKLMILLATLLTTIPYGLGAERANEDNEEPQHSNPIVGPPTPADVEGWIEYKRRWARDSYAFRPSAPNQRFPYHVDFQATPDNTNHRTRLVAHFYFQDGQRRIDISETNEHLKEIQHRELPEVHRFSNPLMRHYQGQIRSVNVVTRYYERPCFVLGIPGLEFIHSYVSQTLEAGREYNATLTEPDSQGLRGYYQVLAPRTQILGSRYLYSDGSHLYLTRHISEEWNSLTDGLVNIRVPVKYVVHLGHRLTLGPCQFINLMPSPDEFPKQGLYLVEGNGLRLVEEDQDNNLRYRLLPTNNPANLAILPSITVEMDEDGSIGEYLLDISNSEPLLACVRTLKFPVGLFPTNTMETFVSLLSLKRRLPQLENLDVGGRNLMEEGRSLLALMNNCAPEALLGRNVLEELFNEQRNQNIVGVFFEGFDFALHDQARQKSILDSLMIFSKFIINLSLRNCTRLDESYVPQIFQGQLVHANLQGCSAVTNSVVDFIVGHNPNLLSLDLSGTAVNLFGEKGAPKLFPQLQTLVLNNCPSLSGVYLNAPLLATLRINDDRLLETVSVLGANLRHISCRNTRIKDESLFGIFDQTKQFIELDIAGCTQLTLTGQRIFLSLNDVNERTGLFTNAGLKDNAARVLSLSRTLTSLNFCGNNIGEQGILSFCANASLIDIDLSNNKIGTVGARAIAELLRRNRTVKTLYLKDNLIDDEGAHAIAQVLGQNTTLQLMDLTNNRISEGAKIQLKNSKSQILQKLLGI